MGMLYTERHPEDPFGWPSRLAYSLKEFWLAAPSKPAIYEAIFQPYDHGLNAIYLDEMSFVELRAFAQLLEEYIGAKACPFPECEATIPVAVSLIQEVMNSKCLH